MDNYIKLIVGIAAITILIFTFNPTFRAIFNRVVHLSPNTDNLTSGISAGIYQSACTEESLTNWQNVQTISDSTTHHHKRCFEETEAHCEFVRSDQPIAWVPGIDGNCNFECGAGKKVFVTKAHYRNFFDCWKSSKWNSGSYKAAGQETANIFDSTEKAQADCGMQETCSFFIGKGAAWLGYNPSEQCFKALDIDYLCLDPNTYDFPAKKICKEDYNGQTAADCDIDCGAGKAIFITLAQFGNAEWCDNYKGHTKENRFQESNWIGATRSIKLLCEGKQRCTFHIKGNGESFLGDPSRGCEKDLEITYFCAGHNKEIQGHANYGLM